MRPSGRMLLPKVLPLHQLHHFKLKILVPNINVGKHPPAACDKCLNHPKGRSPARKALQCLKERELGSSWSWNEVLCRDGMCFSPWISCLSIPDQCLAAGCSSHVRHSPCKWIALCKAQHFVLTLQPMTSSSPSLRWMKKGHSHFWSSPSQGRWWKSYLPKSFPTYLFQLA